MRILGISEGFHDAGVCLIEDQKILYASHSERYSRIKNDRNVHPKQYKKSHKICRRKSFHSEKLQKNV